MPFVMDKLQSQNGILLSKEFALLTEILWDNHSLSIVPFVQNKDYLYLVSHLDILEQLQLNQCPKTTTSSHYQTFK